MWSFAFYTYELALYSLISIRKNILSMSSLTIYFSYLSTNNDCTWSSQNRKDEDNRKRGHLVRLNFQRQVFSIRRTMRNWQKMAKARPYHSISVHVTGKRWKHKHTMAPTHSHNRLLKRNSMQDEVSSSLWHVCFSRDSWSIELN